MRSRPEFDVASSENENIKSKKKKKKKKKMVRITVDLIRKRAEHNEGEISTLEEISLHQENIERIELLNQACRNLKILLMQNNVIERIENLNMLKRLEYLNLALNNIEIIENLDGLESLKKLDLTVNFIGDVRDVQSLRLNRHLEILYLTGNPCTDYENYREYVVATLPKLRELDGMKIERSERIMALRNYAGAKDEVVRAYENYREMRKSQLNEYRDKTRSEIEEISNDHPEDNEAAISAFWNAKSSHTPEERKAIAEMCQRRDDERSTSTNNGESENRRVPKLFNADGRPYNVNQSRIKFNLDDETDPSNVILEIDVYRHLDTSHLDVDVRPDYVRVTIKNKILQLCLPCEVSVNGSVAERNVTTGRLVVTMPRLELLPVIKMATRKNETVAIAKKEKSFRDGKSCGSATKRELLEIGPSSRNDIDLDFSRIYRNKSADKGNEVSEKREKRVSDDFVDDPCVPPLE